MDITPTTLLDAVNYLLETIEEEPITTLLDQTDPDVIAAIRFIDTTARGFQAKGWEFNTEYSFTLSRDLATGTIPLPENTLSVTVPGQRVASRDGLLFNRTDQTTLWDSDQTGTVILLLAFEDMPESARSYVTAAAAFRFQSRRAPDELVARLTKGEVNDALYAFIAEDTRMGGFSFSHNTAIQNRPR